jgi:hypothetical protein
MKIKITTRPFERPPPAPLLADGESKGVLMLAPWLALLQLLFVYKTGPHVLACPYFMPTQQFDDAGWLHPARLPLGRGWSGHCVAPGHQGFEPTDVELRELCNLGYAASCPRLPPIRPYDAVRFSVARDRGSQLTLWVICEAAHRPALHGQLEYDAILDRWASPHSDACIQKMAECYVQAYLLRRVGPAHLAASANL